MDGLTADQITGFSTAQVDSGQVWLVLDLSAVDFMSSAGLRGILEVAKRCRDRDGDLRMAAAQTGVERTLDISGLSRILETYPSVQEATANFGP
jgi:anti-anti-sigma factor